MKLRLLSETVSEPYGTGARWGQTRTQRYQCPCQQGEVVAEIETMDGFKSRWTSIECPVCAEKYMISRPDSREWGIIPRDCV